MLTRLDCWQKNLPKVNPLRIPFREFPGGKCFDASLRLVPFAKKGDVKLLSSKFEIMTGADKVKLHTLTLFPFLAKVKRKEAWVRRSWILKKKPTSEGWLQKRGKNFTQVAFRYFRTETTSFNPLVFFKTNK